MSTRILLPTRKWLWFASLLSLLVVVGAAQAMERLRIPDDLTVPIYAWGFHDEDSGWTATVFYYPPTCVPPDFNLLSGADPNIGPACLMLMEGFTLWEEGASAPSQVVLQNAEGTLVPIYFVRRSELYAGIADGDLTVGELEGMNSLRVGMADLYHEVWHPSDAPKGIWQRDIRAWGTLEDGRRFFMHFEGNDSNYNATVRFED